MTEIDTGGADLPTTSRREAAIAVLTILAIAAHLVLRFGVDASELVANVPLFVAYVLGGVPLVYDLLRKLLRREFGSDLLAGISIVTAVFLDEYLAGALVILMLSGGEALEAYAVRSASSVLEALARRMPSSAHVKRDARLVDVDLDDVEVGDHLVIFPHEVCPVDGIVVDGHGVMDESYLTGEPYTMSKTPGAAVLSGAINGETALTIRAERRAVDSRYAKIMEVMRVSQQRRPRMRRLADQLGGLYTPVAVAIALLAWIVSGEAVRFLAVLVVATPCPLLIAIPVAIIGSISLAAKRSIIVKDPVTLELADRCRTMIFDKTGTLTYGEPQLIEQVVAEGWDPSEVLSLVTSIERYSKHPLADAIVRAGTEAAVAVREASEISERPGEGLRGTVGDRRVRITGRTQLLGEMPELQSVVPPQAGGLECMILLDDRYAATYRFRDTPRSEGASFVDHLQPKHGISRVMLVSGDRLGEVEHLARQVGIDEVHADKSPEEKVQIVRAATAQAKTIYVGDGINDAPALLEATVGVAFGPASDITTEAAGVVVMDTSLERVDEFLHISKRMRRIAMQSAVGGMALSIVGMLVAAAGYLPPVAGAVTQEIIDIVVVVNALRVALPPRELTDFD